MLFGDLITEDRGEREHELFCRYLHPDLHRVRGAVMIWRREIVAVQNRPWNS
jgi:hypothetical protein